MNRTFNKRVPQQGDALSHGYDVWKVYEDGVEIGWYFVPSGVSAEEYEGALISAKNKLIALGLTDLEAESVVGRQLF